MGVLIEELELRQNIVSQRYKFQNLLMILMMLSHAIDGFADTHCVWLISCYNWQDQLKKSRRQIAVDGISTIP